MKRLKWEPIWFHEANMESDNVEAKRRSMVAKRLHSYYMNMTNGSTDFEDCAGAILTFGAAMHEVRIHHSLIQLEVPFAVRRQLYEMYPVIGDHIHMALNCKDKYYNLWTNVPNNLLQHVDKASLARSLWKWYYGVFEPIAKRYEAHGSEHFQNFK